MRGSGHRVRVLIIGGIMNKRIVLSALLASTMLLASCDLLTGTDKGGDETAASTALETEAPAIESEEAAGTSVIETQATETEVTEAEETQVTETSETETDESQMPDDEEGTPLTDEEISSFFASNADTFLMSSGAGGWGSFMTVNSDGTFDYNYHDSDFDMFYICHAQGRLGNVVMIDEYTYKVEILEMTFEYEVNSEWTVTDTDGSEINYTASDSYGLHQGDILTYFARGIEAASLPEGYTFWYCAPRALNQEDVPDPFPLAGYYNAVEEAAYIEDDYE